jgi:acyl transferase domain-containing protein
MALRVPRADGLGAFWSALTAGRVALPADGTTAGQIDRFREFDAELFGMTAAQAAATDPQHRVLAELVWSALEDAGVDPARSTARFGVFVGCGPDAYLRRHVEADTTLSAALGPEQIMVGNSRDFLAAGLAYRFGLTGPSVTVQTACSTSLVAVHQAVRSLLTYECDVAIAGAATVHPDLRPTYDFLEGGILSPDGRCRAFTAGSSGTVPSSGAGVVVLRRADDLGDGHPRALIVGSAVNNDGGDRMSLTAPSPRGQGEVIREALATAGLGGADVGFVETHGTGTPLGDAVELAGLADAYGATRCALGAVKVNVGHTDTAAGVIGLVKAVLAVEEGLIPPTPSQPGDGPDVPFGPAGFFLPREPLPWPSDLPRRAAVSSFGLGGTNAHVIVAPAGPAAEPTAQPGEDHVVTVSAATAATLRRMLTDLAAGLPGLPVAEVVRGLRTGRRELPHRWAVALPADPALAAERLRAALTGAVVPDAPPPGSGMVALLPGQGTVLAGVGSGYAATDPGYARDLAELTELVTAAGGPALADAGDWPESDARFRDTAVVQPLLFVLGIAGLRLLDRRGVHPRALFGHSVGELVAAVHAGVLSPPDGATAVVRRGALMAAARPGAMVAVRLGEAAARDLAAGLPLDVCAVNAPDNTVLGGDPEAVDHLLERCRQPAVQATRLDTTRAFHSRHMTDAADAFAEALRGLPMAAPRIPVVSNLTGTLLTPQQATDPGYWGRQLAAPVRVDAGMAAVLELNPAALVGVARGRTMTNLAHQAARRTGRTPVVTDLFGDGTDEAGACAAALAELWVAGCPVRFTTTPPRRRIGLPGYPFGSTVHWAGPAVEPAPADAADPGGAETAVPADPSAVGDVVTRHWQAAFGGPPLTPQDNFFTLGGTSLQAAHLIAAVAGDLLVDVRLSDLYEHSDLGGFVARIDELTAERDDEALLKLLTEIEAGQ